MILTSPLFVGSVVIKRNSASGSRYGSGRSMAWFTTANTVVMAAMPSAKSPTASAVKAGRRTSDRAERTTSCAADRNISVMLVRAWIVRNVRCHDLEVQRILDSVFMNPVHEPLRYVWQASNPRQLFRDLIPDSTQGCPGRCRGCGAGQRGSRR